MTIIVNTITGIVIGIVSAGIGVPLMNIEGGWIFYILMPLVFGSMFFWLGYSTKLKEDNKDKEKLKQKISEIKDEK